MLTYRRATKKDVPAIVALLLEDDLAKSREKTPVYNVPDACYYEAFSRTEADPNQYLILVELAGAVVATCHLTIMPSMTFQGATRMQVEAVRVAEMHRGKGIGEWMILAAIAHGETQGASVMQLSVNKQRPRSKKFYEKLGFEATHEGMKRYF